MNFFQIQRKFLDKYQQSADNHSEKLILFFDFLQVPGYFRGIKLLILVFVNIRRHQSLLVPCAGDIKVESLVFDFGKHTRRIYRLKDKVSLGKWGLSVKIRALFFKLLQGLLDGRFNSTWAPCRTCQETVISSIICCYKLLLESRAKIYIHLDENPVALLKAFAMNLLDIAIIAVMTFLILRGLFRGFFMEIASLAGVILGILLGIRFHPRMTVYLRPHLEGIDLFILQLISFILIFLSVLILCNLTGWGIKTILRKTSLSWTDKVLGAGLAVLKGVVVIYLAIVMLTVLLPSKTPVVARSRLAPLIITSYQSVAGLISPEFYRNWKRRVLGEKKEINRSGLPQKENARFEGHGTSQTG